LSLKARYTSFPDGEIARTGLSLYVSFPFIVTGIVHV